MYHFYTLLKSEKNRCDTIFIFLNFFYPSNVVFTNCFNGAFFYSTVCILKYILLKVTDLLLNKKKTQTLNKQQQKAKKKKKSNKFLKLFLYGL